MLEMIIKTSSNPNDLIMDFYCGSGTTLLAAARTKRNFIGIDESDEAIRCSKEKLVEYKFRLK